MTVYSIWMMRERLKVFMQFSRHGSFQFAKKFRFVPFPVSTSSYLVGDFNVVMNELGQKSFVTLGGLCRTMATG